MTLLTTSLLDTKAYDFSVLRYIFESQIVQSGVVNKGDYLVTAKASQPPMGVSVAAGAAWVKATTGTRNGAYHVVNDGSVDITLTAADATNPRVDRIILRVADTSDLASATDTATLEVLSGTPSSGATLVNLTGAAAQPANTLNLAFVLVGAGVTSVVSANIGNWLDPIGTAAGSPVVSGAVTTAAPAFALGRAANTTPYLCSTLPTSPFDGQEIYYQSTTAGTGGGATDTMATAGNVFHLRYRAASASAYKWEVIGAAPISHASAGATNASVASTTWSQISATLDPRVTVPLAGEYYVRHAAGLNNTATGTLAIGVKLNTTEPSGAFEATSGLLEQTTAAVAYWLSAAGRVTMATANTVILQRYYKSSAGTTTLSLYNASLSVVPIRVG